MSKKCKHKEIANKFFLAKKYGEDIRVKYSYCIKCGEIFSGSVSFINWSEIGTAELTHDQKDKKLPVKTKKPTIKKKKTVKKSKEDKKVINKRPRKQDSELRKKSRKPDGTTNNERKPSAPQAPEGISLGDIVRAKYDLPTKNIKQEKTMKESGVDPNEEILDDTEDLDVFLK